MKKYIPQLFVAFIFLYLLFLIRPALLGQLTGTFKSHTVPQEYTKLEQFLSRQKQFGRTFWIPGMQRFGFYSATHPAVSGEDFYHVASISGVLANLKKENAEKYLQDAGVKYVVVPYDSEGEIFLKDRKYDEATYEKTVDAVRKISWLTEIPGFGKIHVFVVKNPKDHFWTEGSAYVSYQFISPTEYIVRVENAQKGDRIIFAENYDSGWKAFVDNTILSSQPFEQSLNSFVIPKNGSVVLKVFYQPQMWVNKAVWISELTCIIVVIGLLFSGYSWLKSHKMVK